MRAFKESEYLELFQNIASSDVSAVIFLGDLASIVYTQMFDLLRIYREVCPNLKTFLVKGNHDLWRVGSKASYLQVTSEHKAFFKENKIEYVSGRFIKFKKWIFCGFDGWYQHPYPPSNDEQCMWTYINGVYIHAFLREKAISEVQKILKYKTESPMLVMTHFNLHQGEGLYESLSGLKDVFERLAKKCDVLLYGHTHQPLDITVGKCRVVNPGVSYKDANVGEISILKIIEV